MAVSTMVSATKKTMQFDIFVFEEKNPEKQRHECKTRRNNEAISKLGDFIFL